MRRRRWFLTRYWHRWGRLWWYLGTNTAGAGYGWRWFRQASGFTNSRHANFGKLHVVWHEKPERR